MTLPIRKILLGTDLSEPSMNAMLHADAIAQMCHAELTAMYAEVLHDDLAAGVMDTYWEQFEGRVGDRLKAVSEEYSVSFTPRVERDVSARNAILRTAEDIGADLIVVGTHGRTGIGRFVLGSTAEGVVRDAPVSVLVVHHTTAHAPYKKLLVPVDLSEQSRETLKYAARLAAEFDAELGVVHVVEPVSVPPYFPMDYVPPEPVAVHETVEQFVRESLDGQSFILHVLRGPAASTICKIAEDEGYDVIVTGTRGLHGVAHLALGSTTERVVRLAGVPVWVHKPAAES